MRHITLKAGDGMAEYECLLADLYSGYGTSELVKPNLKTAAVLYRKAAENGSMQAQYKLGLAFLGGRGIEKNPVKSIEHLEYLVDKGFTPAMYMLAKAYDNRIQFSCKKNSDNITPIQKNISALLLSCKMDCGYEQKDTVEIETEGGPKLLTLFTNKDKKHKYLKMAADQGDASAQYELALMYSNGEEIARDEKTANEYFARAKKQGHFLTRKSNAITRKK